MIAMPTSMNLVAGASGLIGSVLTGIVIALVLVVGLVVVGIVAAVRRRSRGGALPTGGITAALRAGAQPSGAANLAATREKANIALVRLDETLASADNELGFAIAQFGEKRTSGYAEAVATARGLATDSFRLKRELDDAFPESITRQREMTLQMLANAERAQRLLDAEEGAFAALRSQEVEAPKSVAALQDGVAAARARLEPARATLERLAAEYRPTIVDENAAALADATTQLERAAETAERAGAGISPTGVNAVAGDLGTANQALARAVALLDGIDDTAAELDRAAEALTTLVAATKADLAEARRERDDAPDPDTGAAIVDAIDSVERTANAIAAASRPADPITALDRLNAATAELDTALASARNQADRLAHARLALEGTLASARSQVTATRGLIGAGGRRVGADARSRLSEAERELREAEAELDPIVALDGARRAVTNARDADALARFDAMR